LAGPEPELNEEVFPHDLRQRIMSVALVPLLFVVVLLAGYLSHREISAADEALYERGRAMAQRLAETATFDLFAGNDLYLKRLIDFERSAQGCDSIGIADQPGRWRLVSGQRILPPPDTRPSVREWRSGEQIFFSHPIRLSDPATEPDPYLSASPSPPGERSGQVLVVLDTKKIYEAQRKSTLVAASIAVFLLMAASWLAWRLSQGLVRPLNAVIAAVREIAGGNTGTRVKATSAGEIGALEKGINRMAEVISLNASEMEHRVVEATVELREQKTAADAAVIARSRFLAAASHDLRQPMHALTLLVEALKERLQNEGGAHLRLIEQIEASAHSMESLLNALLDISRLDAGIVVARPECFVAGTVFERLAKQYEPLAAEKGLELHVHDSRLYVFTDPVLLQRVLGNLIANAIRYTDSGRVVLGLRRVQKDWVRFEVLDSGKGIPEAYRERIFEEYFQLENPERGRDKGLGLGLAIVKRLAKLLGSPVELRTQVGRGSAFAIRAVRCEPPLGLIADAAQPDHVPLSVASGQRPLVVLIDDDEAILEAMMAVSEHWGIDLAADVEAGPVKADLLELGRKPDAILSDYRLRDGRTGIEVIAELRAEFGEEIPAVLITGDTAAATMQVIEASGLSVLHKPLKPATLRAILGHMLKTDTR
jgi:signal transduction histidine kinase/CheY-like chemotaxis protein